MTQRAPLETLSALALDVWRFALGDAQENALPLLDRFERKGYSVDPGAFSRALNELARAGWAHRGMSGYRRVNEHRNLDAATLPLEE